MLSSEERQPGPDLGDDSLPTQPPVRLGSDNAGACPAAPARRPGRAGVPARSSIRAGVISGVDGRALIPRTLGCHAIGLHRGHRAATGGARSTAGQIMWSTAGRSTHGQPAAAPELGHAALLGVTYFGNGRSPPRPWFSADGQFPLRVNMSYMHPKREYCVATAIL